MSDGRGSTFRAGKRLLTLGAEAEALIETECPCDSAALGSIHPMQPEETPSLSSGERVSVVARSLSELGNW